MSARTRRARSADGAPPEAPGPTVDLAPPELTIVLPVYNEHGSIAAVLEGIEAKVRTAHETLVVYDFDEDTTLPVVRELQPRMPGVRLVRNDLGRGVLNAMKAGMRAARGTYVLVTMADGSDEAADVDPMVALAALGADVVAASRYMPGGRQIGGPRLKRALSRAAGWSLNAIGAIPIHDPTSNFKLYRRSFLEAVEIESTAGFELALELSVKAAVAHRPMAEVPTTWRDRTSGTTRFRLRAWLPHYLHWYRHAIAWRLGDLGRRRPRGRPGRSGPGAPVAG